MITTRFIDIVQDVQLHFNDTQTMIFFSVSKYPKYCNIIVNLIFKYYLHPAFLSDKSTGLNQNPV